MDYNHYFNYNSIIKLLADNITILTNIQIKNYFTMTEEINKLNNQNNQLKNQNSLLEVKLTAEKRKHEECDDSEEKRQKTNKYTIKVYRKNKFSYEDEQLNLLFNNMKSINDIINLENEWQHIRHNYKLQKLYHLIPALKKLASLIGLENIKTDIFKTIIYYVQNGYTDEYLHTVIQGPPGVGKTEFAKIYANIFVRLGILQTDNFIEIKRDDLVAEYLGQTSHRTKKLLEKGMGGVVFLDEAYSLGNAEKRDSFAKEAIDMINQYLSERKSEFMFIIAGYENDLETCFFSFNQGLKRRFSHYFKIEKYSDKELMEIFRYMVIQKRYELDIPNEKLYSFFRERYDKFENYAGDIEKLVNFVKYEQSNRCFILKIENRKIILDDLIESFKKINFKEKIEPKTPLWMYT